jgi:hypothetical protein
MTSRGPFAQLLAPGLASVIYEDLEMHPEEFGQTFNVMDSDKAYEEDQLVAGLAAVPTKPEGSPTKLDDPIQGGSYRYQHISYGLGFQVTIEMWEDDQYGIMKRVSQDFAGSIRQTVESNAANVLNNSFTTQTSIDGVSLCNTAHPLLGSSGNVSTYSNQSATNGALSVTILQELLLLFEGAVNERGLIKRMVPEGLLIRQDLQFKAGEILYSSLAPYTGTNEVNTMQGRLRPYINHYLTSASAFWVLSAKSGHTLKKYWRRKPTFDSQDDYSTKGANFSTFFRTIDGATYWHGIAGSKGA